ncbi:hypothetical protein ACFX2F_022879 [Malus domestica]
MTAQANINYNEASGSSFSNDNGHGFSAGDNWIINTGATYHMTVTLNNLNQVTPDHGDEKITTGNGAGLALTHTGSTTISTFNNSLLLRNVLCVPKSIVNILFVKKLCKDNRCWFRCETVVFFIQDKTKWVILYQGQSDGRDFFTVPVNVFSNSFAARLEIYVTFLGKNVQTSVRHKRLGHPSEKVIAAILKT